MSIEQPFDLLMIFAEGQGHLISQQDAEFCRAIVNGNTPVKAAELVGIADPELVADERYYELAELIEAWREEHKTDYINCLNTYRAAQQASIIRDDTEVPQHEVRMRGAKGLCEMLGFEAAKKADVTLRTQIPPELRSKLDDVYKIANKAMEDIND